MSKTTDIVVTFLEMTSEPAPQAYAKPYGQLAILRAQNMPRHYYRYLLKTIEPGKTWSSHHVDLYDETDDALHAESKALYILYVNGVPGGILEADWQKDNSVQISYLGVMPELTGQGYGRYLLDQIVHLLWNEQPDRIVIQTSTEDHPRALTLLQRMGFQVIKQDREQRKAPLIIAANMDDPS